MAVRATMSNLITRTRLLINDIAGASQVFADSDVQDVLDASRLDVKNQSLRPLPTYVSGTIQYLDFYADLTDWEDDTLFKQYLTTIVTPSVFEPIAGHWQFAASTFPPVFLSGKTYDVYRSAADLLERWAARYVTRFNFTSDSQSFQISQVPRNMAVLAKSYRMQQRAIMMSTTRTDASVAAGSAPSLEATSIDYMASG